MARLARLVMPGPSPRVSQSGNDRTRRRSWGRRTTRSVAAYADNDPVNNADPNGEASVLIFRSVLGLGNHGFIVVTNPDGSVRARYSYGPQSNDRNHPGQLVEEQGNPNSFTTQGDRAAFSSGKDVTGLR